MTDEQIEAIRSKNEDDKAVQAVVVQPESQIVRMAETIDALLAEVKRLRNEVERLESMVTDHECEGQA